MDMNRRKVLVGLGAAAAGTGVVFGTGAFTQVEAERDVEIDVADDSVAFLALIPGATEFVEEDEDGVVGVDLRSSEEGGDGVNLDAYTEIADALTVENQGGQEVDLSVEVEVENNSDEGVTLVFEEETLGSGGSTNADLQVATGDADTAGTELEGTLPNDLGDNDVTLTITADAGEE